MPACRQTGKYPHLDIDKVIFFGILVVDIYPFNNLEEIRMYEKNKARNTIRTLESEFNCKLLRVMGKKVEKFVSLVDARLSKGMSLKGSVRSSLKEFGLKVGDIRWTWYYRFAMIYYYVIRHSSKEKEKVVETVSVKDEEVHIENLQFDLPIEEIEHKNAEIDRLHLV